MANQVASFQQAQEKAQERTLQERELFYSSFDFAVYSHNPLHIGCVFDEYKTTDAYIKNASLHFQQKLETDGLPKLTKEETKLCESFPSFQMYAAAVNAACKIRPCVTHVNVTLVQKEKDAFYLDFEIFYTHSSF